MKNKIILLSLSILSGIALWLSWYPTSITFLIFFAFIPLFFISETIVSSSMRHPFWKGVGYSFPAFLIWNAATTWWIWNSTAEGSLAAFILNALFMSIIFGFWTHYRTRRHILIPHPVLFITLWMSFELLHLHWDLQWPWLNLGNVFAPCTQYIQWYSITGTFGGTLWILLLNFLIFGIIKSAKENKQAMKRKIIITLALFLIPVLSSVLIFSNYKIAEKDGVEAVVVQPNTDPYAEQFLLGNDDFVLRIIESALPKITDSTAIILTPESSIHRTVIENLLVSRKFSPENPNYYGITLFDSLFQIYPKINVIAGISTVKFYDHPATITAQDNGNGTYMDVFNTAMSYNRNGAVDFYHKSHLVPGVEKMPFAKVLHAIGFDNVVINLGGPRSPLGTDTLSRPLIASADRSDLKIGVPICYESVFGEVCGEFVQNGASFLGIITNDAWWGETPGHQQHFIYAKLRAVESRRYVIRAANTGISAIIDPRGEVLEQTRYNERTAISGTIYPNEKLTFYTKHGDYLARFAVGILIITLLSQLIFAIYKRISARKNSSSAPNL